MSLIAPKNKVYLLSGCPLTNNRNTLTWSSKSAQSSYFLSLAVKSFTDYSYIFEEGTQAVAVEANAMDLANVNYIMFQNADYSSKWFYGFIDRVEFLSEDSAAVYYTLDMWQTYFFDFTFRQCLVEREHVADDSIGANTLSDNDDIGLPIVYERDFYSCSDNKKIMLVTTFNSDGSTAEGNIYSGIYSGARYLLFDFGESLGINGYLDYLTEENLQDGVVDIYMVSGDFAPTDMESSAAKNVITKTYSIRKPYQNINGYVPKNKKLFTYPYNFLMLETSNGQTRELRYELFRDSSCNFRLRGTVYNIPQISCAPVKYNSQSGDTDAIEDTVILDGFPHCAWSYDTFKAWLAQNGGAMAVQSLATGVSILAAGAVNPVAGLAMAGTSLLNTAASLEKAEQQPPSLKGSSSGGLMFGAGQSGFYFLKMQVKQEIAKIIDDKFSVYGYPIYKKKNPDIYTRPVVNYLQTKDANISVNAPMEVAERMQNDVNNGMWFWHNPNTFGNFDTDNSPN